MENMCYFFLSVSTFLLDLLTRTAATAIIAITTITMRTISRRGREAGGVTLLRLMERDEMPV